LPRWRIIGPKTMLTLSGRPMPGLSRITCPGEDPPGDRAMVVENPACLTDSCQR